ncbi:MAG: site-specific integrase [candidate division Zixibacteria bacterium]|nr:site-specific integrase [candidate division Zixibacteria bacterium]
MARIYKRGQNWYLDIRVKGRRVRRKVGNSKKVAELALKDAEVKVARHEFGFARKDITIDKLLTLFLEYSQTNHRETSTIRYTSVLESFKYFIEKKTRIICLSEITPETIEKYKIFRRGNSNGQLVKSGEEKNTGLKARTVNFELKTLNNLFNRAIEWGYLKDNPVIKIQKLKVDNSKPVRFLSEKECKKFLKTCSEKFYPIFFTYLNTGMRKSELINLEWNDIDFRRRKIKIQWKEFWQPKTGKREIPMSQNQFELLQKLKQENDNGINSSFVFPHKDGGIIKIKLRGEMINIAEKAGVENLTKLHTLRHTFASHLVMKGVDLPTVMKLMGHSDIQTTMIYAHLAPDHLADAVEKLEF